jgi:transcriptional regulator with XRE-family HTH domain
VLSITAVVTRTGPGGPPRVFLREWRKHVGITQQVLAERLDTDKANVSRWERWAAGEHDDEDKSRQPNASTLQSIATALGLENAGELFYAPGAGEPLIKIVNSIPEDRYEQALEILQTFQRVAKRES